MYSTLGPPCPGIRRSSWNLGKTWDVTREAPNVITICPRSLTSFQLRPDSRRSVNPNQSPGPSPSAIEYRQAQVVLHCSLESGRTPNIFAHFTPLNPQGNFLSSSSLNNHGISKGFLPLFSSHSILNTISRCKSLALLHRNSQEIEHVFRVLRAHTAHDALWTLA